MRKKGKRFLSTILSFFIAATAAVLPASAEGETAANPFTFQNGSMSKETLRAYASRAVSLAGFCAEGTSADPLFEDDLRMVCHVGAKYIGRAAYYSWSGNMTYAQVQEHYALAEARAKLAHAIDPELILQAGVFEIIYRDTVNNTPVPDWVLEAFDQQIVARNFRFDDMLFPTGHQYGVGYWGNPNSAVPNIAKLETQMYFYWQICRYIDAGFEAVHCGQAEMMMDYNAANAGYWDTVTTKARAYAQSHARRGIVLFDCHTALDSNGIKVGNRLVMDIHAAGLVPNETSIYNGAMMAEISDYTDNGLQWIGRSGGGQHPLGFQIDQNFMILEFDNYGSPGPYGIATPQAFYNWGYDDITWFAVQPSWYRNQFLYECDDFLKNHRLDTEGKQVYFLQPALRRVLDARGTLPAISYIPGDAFNDDFFYQYVNREAVGVTDNGDGSLSLTVTDVYRANNQSDACPIGFGQEDTIRDIFLGDTADSGMEIPTLTAEYGVKENYIRREFAIAAEGKAAGFQKPLPVYDESLLASSPLQGAVVDAWGRNDPQYFDHRRLMNGQTNTFQLTIRPDAQSLRLDNWIAYFGQAGNFDIQISADGTEFSSIASFEGFASGDTLMWPNFRWESLQRSETQDAANRAIVTAAPINPQTGKKTVYLRFVSSLNGTNGLFGYNYFEVHSVSDCRLSNIAIQKEPQKIYYIGDSFQPEAGRMLATFADGSQMTIPLTAATITGFDSTTAGWKELTVSYRGYSMPLYILVTEAPENDGSHTGEWRIDAAPINTVSQVISSSGVQVVKPFSDNIDYFDIWSGGQITYQVDLPDRTNNFTIGGWGTFENCRFLASKDNGETWYSIAKVENRLALGSVSLPEQGVQQKWNLTNIDWILTGNPQKQFQLKIVTDDTGGSMQALYANIILNYTYHTGKENDNLDCPAIVPADYPIPHAIARFSQMPRTVYETGTSFDPSGGQLSISRLDGTIDNIPLSNTTITGYSSETVGFKTLSVIYHEFHLKLIVQIIPHEADDTINGEWRRDIASSLETSPDVLVYYKATPSQIFGPPTYYMNIGTNGYVIYEVDLHDRTTSFNISGWGAYQNCTFLASKDNGQNWLPIAEVTNKIGLGSVSLPQNNDNIQTILSGNPQKKFLLKIVCGNGFQNQSVEAVFANIILNYTYHTGLGTYETDLPIN